MTILDFRQSLLEAERGLPHTVEKAGRQHDVEHGVGHAHRQRIAAEGRAVGAGGHAFRRLARCQAGADREPAAKRLGERHDVRLNADTLIGE